MSRKLALKIAVIAVLMLLLLIPLGMISGLVNDRMVQRDTAQLDVRRSTSGLQAVTGPVLVVPYRRKHVSKEQVPTTEMVPAPPLPGATIPAAQFRPSNATAPAKPAPRMIATTVMKVVEKVSFTDHVHVVLPENLRVDGHVDGSVLYRGIYPTRRYAADLVLRGKFAIDLGTLAKDDAVSLGDPFVAIGVGDVRGIRNTPTLRWDDKGFSVRPASRLPQLGAGFHAPLPDLDLRKATSAAFELPLLLSGMDKLTFSPFGKHTAVNIASDWPHPSFFGRFLPVHREISDAGFTAGWKTSWLAADIGRAFLQAVADNGPAPTGHEFGVSLVDPVDPYVQTDRVIKYGELFVLLTFAAFFLFEMIRRLRIHPMQYALVGTALAAFYLLLIALSEHIPFPAAYAIGAGACVALISFYLVHVLGHWRRGVGFGAMLAVLYGALYVVNQSEDYALLLGSAVVFATLAGFMVLTRRLDWYAIGANEARDGGMPAQASMG